MQKQYEPLHQIVDAGIVNALLLSGGLKNMIECERFVFAQPHLRLVGGNAGTDRAVIDDLFGRLRPYPAGSDTGEKNGVRNGVRNEIRNAVVGRRCGGHDRW